MISRRRFLVAGGATVVVGAAAAGVIELRDRSGDEPSPVVAPAPQQPISTAPGARVLSGTLTSAHLDGPAGWAMWLPAATPVGVVLCLHGFHEDHRFPFDDIHLPDLALAHHLDLAIAAVDGGADSYWHPRADGSDAQAMLFDDFIPLVQQQTGTAPLALMGWSMGGYGALLAAETAPDRFRAVVAASPALWTSPGATAPGAFDGASDYRAHDVFENTAALRGLTVRVDCGDHDPFVSATKQFVRSLDPAPQGGFSPGAHDDAYWQRVAPDELRTIADAVARG